tara:strand:- start:1269 stop:1580 length:312 start_codon:yes stop_codon:yes gene_type:complete
MELKKIGILSLGKIAGLFGVIYGLISGILFLIILSRANQIPGLTEQLGFIAQLGNSSIIVLPILNGIIYFLVGIIAAFLYNLIAKKIGGIELELDEKKPRKKK